MSKLYEISGQLKALSDQLEEGEFTQEMVKDTLDGLEGEFNEKALSLVKVMANNDGTVDAIDAEINRLQARKKSILNAKESLKNYLRENMERSGISKITSPLFNITLVKGRETAVVDNELELPDEYVELKQVLQPDKRAILEALKQGPVPGAHISRAKSAVRIK